jgi:hypothetical protein
MSTEDKIDELNEKIIDLSFDLKKSKDKELIYKDILFNIETSLNVLIKKEEENERFKFNDVIDYKEALFNLKKSLDQYKYLYKLKF